ncbi:MAG: DNA-binding response regulator, partial [Bacteroidota bacterium]|nr:DNA-binding response regulator [Bacteroidota bacterium]
NVIFTTAYEHYAIKAIRSCALDYLLKPLDIDDLVSAVNKVKNEQDLPDLRERKDMFLYNSHQKEEYKRKIALPSNDGLLFISLEDILYCEADNNYTTLYLKSKEKTVVCKTLNYFEDILGDEYFCRTHQSFLVNINHIRKYVKGRGGYIIMNDGTKVEVSARMKSTFLDRFGK